MSLQFIRGYWIAWRILPISGKVLLILGYAVSGFIYWAGSSATVTATVTSDQIQITQIMGIALLGGMTAMFILALTAINVVMDKHPEKATTLLAKFDGVPTEHFWNQFSTPKDRNQPKGGPSLKSTVSLTFLWIFNLFCWTILLRLIQPDSFWSLVFANIFVTTGSLLITIGVLFWKRLA